ncbi:aminotransferase class I/II-fold pyridoxal phosphate-dependent enzyme [Tissierella sp. Yu-01]|uniref:threonine aldolase family protein n=1 Tax=Tissierella sp. Yu-01 TaxID=3035694 RepID=UPI00240E3A3C|nr:aminotransferase class I/II-fold pyridoxal phosphate-dependent enzyme [Tissierella sp. Yu-01]WFA08959.1 aminotransferase class V-fold PLP-dependent enzyme [Tissierella sp. Yu-01]
MYSFTNDYSEGAHPRVLELLNKYNLEQNAGYGEDIHSENAKNHIKKLMNRKDVDIHFIPGGTQTNLIVISSFLRPHQAVISPETGHIHGHETGAIEATGHKIITVSGKDGKLTPEGIKKVVEFHKEEYTVKPKMVYISNSTELGTIYTKEELRAISKVCKEYELILFLDGARLASALTCSSNDISFKDLSELVDVFYIGGTKNGALLGEALVIVKEELKEDFRYFIKQRGAMLAKGFVMGIQFEALFQDDLYFELGKHANEMSNKIAGIIKSKGFAFQVEPCSNQLFPILPDSLLEELEKEFSFIRNEKIDDDHTAIRLVTSWATTNESVEALGKFFENVNNK